MRLRSNMRDDLEMTLAGAKFFVLCSGDASMHENLKKTVKAKGESHNPADGNCHTES